MQVAVSVGAVGDERKLINVKAEIFPRLQIEAINGSQLYAVNPHSQIKQMKQAKTAAWSVMQFL